MPAAPRALLLLGALGTAGCIDADKDEAPSSDAAEALDPTGDDDGDGFTNSEESAAGSDPLDAADVPYTGGWRKGACRDEVSPTGNRPGEVAEDFALVDQFGDTVHLHDFCDRVVLIEFSGFT